MSCACQENTQNCGCLKIKIGNGCSPCFSVCAHDGREPEFISLAEFLPRVRLVAQGVPDDVALEYLNAAAVRFARTTGILKRRLKTDIQAGVQDYFLSAGENERLYRLDKVEQCGDGDYRFLPPDKLWLEKMPCQDKCNGLIVYYTAIPNQNACAVDKILYDNYHDGIVAGALAELLLMRKYAFSDGQMAMVYEQKFKQASNQAANDLFRQFDNRPIVLNGGVKL